MYICTTVPVFVFVISDYRTLRYIIVLCLLADFFSTSQMVEGSSLKDEIREGHIVTTEPSIPIPPRTVVNKGKRKGSKNNK